MPDLAQQLLQTQLPDDRLAIFAQRLTDWLIADLNQSEDDVPAFTESRAKALLRAANVIDDPTLHDFMKLVESDTAVRLALHDLLLESGLAENDEIQAAAATSAAAPESDVVIHWLSLAVAAHAWKSGYPLYQLDPASPPGEYSPAGQLVKRAAYFLRQQIQRSATERDKLARKLAFTTDAASRTPSLDDLPNEQPVAPLPPYYRPPIPVNYPEVARDTVQVEPDERGGSETAVPRSAPITITNADLEPDAQQPVRMPPISISKDQVNQVARQQPQPSRQVRQPTPRNSESEFSQAVRQQWSRSREPMRTTKMRVIVQEYPDGSAMYGLQVRVTCKGVKSYVAGTTNRDGLFFCELPVRIHSGLTYDVDVTWPRDLGGNTERKSITLNADRTQFDLPFYMRHNA